MCLGEQELESINTSHAAFSCCWPISFLTFPCFLNRCNLVLRFQCFFYCDTSLGFQKPYWFSSYLLGSLLLRLHFLCQCLKYWCLPVSHLHPPCSILSPGGISTTCHWDVDDSVTIPLNSRLYIKVKSPTEYLHLSISMHSTCPKLKSFFPSLFLFLCFLFHWIMPSPIQYSMQETRTCINPYSSSTSNIKSIPNRQQPILPPKCWFI